MDLNLGKVTKNQLFLLRNLCRLSKKHYHPISYHNISYFPKLFSSILKHETYFGNTNFLLITQLSPLKLSCHPLLIERNNFLGCRKVIICLACVQMLQIYEECEAIHWFPTYFRRNDIWYLIKEKIKAWWS